MRTLIVLGLTLVATIAAAGPKVPAAPGKPPSLDGIPAKGVTIVAKGKATPAEIWLEGHDTWKLQVRTKAGTFELELPKLAVGTYRGTPKTGAWVVEITAAAPGYLKSPGACSGRIAAWFADTTYVVGTFESAGCLSYKQAP
jgi:hypothetical protein